MLPSVALFTSRPNGGFGVVGPLPWSSSYLQNATELNYMSDKRSKKSSKKSQRHISLGVIPAGIAVGPLGFRAELAEAGVKSEQSRPYHDLGPMALIRAVPGEEDTRTLRIVSRENKNEDQGPAATKVSTSGNVVGGGKQGDNPTSERFYSLRFGLMFISLCPHQRTLLTLEREKASRQRRRRVRVNTNVATTCC